MIGSTTLHDQYVQAALTAWRSRNRWADEIPFDQFPAETRDAIVMSASINMQRPSGDVFTTALPVTTKGRK